jgi:transcription termination factor Rho
MSVLDRSALDDSPLADLHAIASELAIDGYRRLRRADLIDSILTHQGAAAESAGADSVASSPGGAESAGGRRGVGVRADSVASSPGGELAGSGEGEGEGPAG